MWLWGTSEKEENGIKDPVHHPENEGTRMESKGRETSANPNTGRGEKKQLPSTNRTTPPQLLPPSLVPSDPILFNAFSPQGPLGNVVS